MAKERRNDCITCWNLSPVHTGFEQLHQGSFTLHAYETQISGLFACQEWQNNNTNTTRTIYSIPPCLAIITIMNKMTGWEICSFFPLHALILGNSPKTLCRGTVYCIRVSIIYVSCDYCVLSLHIFYASSLYTV